MIKKVIALVFVSFFVMSGLTVLTENNQNYNISINNVNSFTSTPTNNYNYSVKQSITFTSGISGQSLGCYNNVLYYIYNDSISQFSFESDKISTFLSLSSIPNHLEIYDNFMIIGYGNTLFQIYNFSDNKLYTSNFTYSANMIQFSIINNKYIFSLLTGGTIYNCELSLNPFSLSKISSISIDSVCNQFTYAGNKNNIIFAINGGSGCYPLDQFGFLCVGDSSLNASQSNSNDDFGNIYDIMDLGNYGLLGSESYYITDVNTACTTPYSYNSYSTNGNLYFSDSSYNVNFYPMNISNNAYTKLPELSSNSNFQEFCNNGKIVNVYLPIGTGDTVYNTATYIINGNYNLIVVSNDIVYVYPLDTYNLNVKSYNKLSNQIQDYFSLDGTIYTGYSNSFIINKFPQSLIPLNTSTYYYNGSAITIIQSDFSGSGTNLYYNLSIYYNQIQAPSIPLYDIFSYMYPISIIGLFVGMGAFIFTIKKRGYKI